MVLLAFRMGGFGRAESEIADQRGSRSRTRERIAFLRPGTNFRARRTSASVESPQPSRDEAPPAEDFTWRRGQLVRLEIFQASRMPTIRSAFSRAISSICWP